MAARVANDPPLPEVAQESVDVDDVSPSQASATSASACARRQVPFANLSSRPKVRGRLCLRLRSVRPEPYIVRSENPRFKDVSQHRD